MAWGGWDVRLKLGARLSPRAAKRNPRPLPQGSLGTAANTSACMSQTRRGVATAVAGCTEVDFGTARRRGGGRKSELLSAVAGLVLKL